MAPPPSSDPPPAPAEVSDEESSEDDDSEDMATRLHRIPKDREAGPYPGAVVSNRYLLKEQIARGGMGSVWRALDVGLERPVAIKFMDPRIAADEELRRRFAREAKAAARLRTPHVVQIYEFGIESGIPFIAMELLIGEDLHARLKREGAMSLGEVAEIVGQIARGLRSAQDAEVIHRDLKPQNIFLSQEGGQLLVKILDFGVAKIRAAAEKGDETKAGTVLGSPHYMSPEQARGRPDIDHRADIWSLGVIAFRALTGRIAFPGEAPGEVILRICTDPIPVPSDYCEDLPKTVDEVFARALERDPDERYQSALDFAAALARVARLASSAEAQGWPAPAAAVSPVAAVAPMAGTSPGTPPMPGPSPAAGWSAPAWSGRAGPPAGGMGAPATAEQVAPFTYPADGTPASAIQAAEPALERPPDGTPASAIQPVPHAPAGASLYDSSPEVRLLETPPWELAPPPAQIRRFDGPPPAAPLAGAVPPFEPHAPAGIPAGTPWPAFAPDTPPPLPQPETPRPAAEPLPPPSSPHVELPPPLTAGGSGWPGELPPLVSDELDEQAIEAPTKVVPRDAALAAWRAGELAATGDGPGPHVPPAAEDSGPWANSAADDSGRHASVPELALPPDAAQLADAPPLGSEHARRRRGGLSVVGGIMAGAVVLLLIAGVLTFGQPDRPADDVLSAPIPSTLLEGPLPTAPDAGAETPPLEPTTEAVDGGAAPEPTASGASTATPAADTTAAPDAGKPRRPIRPRPADEWGY